MKIMICERCGRLIHRDSRCLHCGNEGMYPAEYDRGIHSAAAAAYAEMEKALSQRQFARVRELSGQVMEWMCQCSDVYWMRLLAAAQCATDRELICTGADLRASADYRNALRCAGSEEHQVYLDVQDAMESVKSELMTQAQEHFAGRKAELDMPGMLKKLVSETEFARLQMLDLWRELSGLDEEIRELDERCRAGAKIHCAALEKAYSRAVELKKEADATTACSEEEYLSMQTRLAAVIQLSEEAAEKRRALEGDHPWLERYQALLERQEELLEKLERQKDDLRAATKQADDRVREFEECLRLEEAMYEAIRSGGFAAAVKGLSPKALEQALIRAGVM